MRETWEVWNVHRPGSLSHLHGSPFVAACSLRYRILLRIRLEPNTFSTAEPQVNRFCLHLRFPYPRWHFLIQVTYVKKNVGPQLFKDFIYRPNFNSQLTKMSSLDNLSWQDTSLFNSLFGIHGAVIVIHNFKSNLDPVKPVETHTMTHCQSL